MLIINKSNQEICAECNSNFKTTTPGINLIKIQCNCTNFIYDMYKFHSEQIYFKINNENYRFTNHFYQNIDSKNNDDYYFPDEIKNKLINDPFKSINDLKSFLTKTVDNLIFY